MTHCIFLIVRSAGFAAATFAMLASPAGAADLPPQAPVPAYRAPVVVPVQQTFAGPYIGVNGGGIFSRSTDSTTVTSTGALVSTGAGNNSGFEVGGQIGYNLMFTPNFLGGIELDGQYSSLSGSVLSVDGSNRHDSKFDSFGTARGRLGVVWSSLLFYGTGGLAFSHGTITRTQLTALPGFPAAGTVETSTQYRFGWTGGGGIEWLFAPHWSVRGEYLYVDLGTSTATFPLADRSQAVGFQAHIGRVAINYIFD